MRQVTVDINFFFGSGSEPSSDVLRLWAVSAQLAVAPRNLK